MATIRCEKCGSLHVSVDTKIDSSYSVKKGLFGRLLFGFGGESMGVGGKKKEIKSFHCQECGWQSSTSMDMGECIDIEIAMNYKDIERLLKYKAKYKNLENVESMRAEDYVVDRNVKVLTRELLLDKLGWEGKKSLQRANIPIGVVSIEQQAFMMCSNLKEVIIPSSVEKISRLAFFMCVELEKIEIPEGVEFIGMSAFKGCEKLKEVKLPSSLITIEAFAFCNCQLEKIEIPENIEVINNLAFGQYLKSVSIPEKVKVLKRGAFQESEN
ncbi:MAG: leucine-rich repeat domain-containing protein, partial [Clostridia bacterium]|nr:leucine-rich repeat domain-containing protein [Clostridia bacterium]